MRKEKTGRFARLRVLAERPEIGILIPLLLIMAVTAVINPNFMTAKNFSSVFKSIPFIAVVTLGAAFPLITGNVDISNGRFVGLTGMLFGVFLVNTRLGVAGSIAACLLIGCILGLLNGFLVVQLRMAGFIATMGTMYICGGLRYLVNGGSVMSNLPYGVKDFAEQTPLGVSWFFWIVVVLYVLAGFVLYKTAFGRRVYAIGSNAEVARLQGVKVERIGICAYVISSVLAALCGTVNGKQLGVQGRRGLCCRRRQPVRRPGKCGRDRDRRIYGLYHQQHHQHDPAVQLLVRCVHRLHSGGSGHDRCGAAAEEAA